jgi:hypothetical protein
MKVMKKELKRIRKEELKLMLKTDQNKANKF